MSDPLSAHLSSSADEAWHQIEGLIEEITQLADADLSTQEFYTELLDRSVRALAAVGGAVWIREPDRQVKVAYQINFPQILLEKDTFGQQSHQSHRQLIEKSFSNAAVQAIFQDACPPLGVWRCSLPNNTVGLPASPRTLTAGPR